MNRVHLESGSYDIKQHILQGNIQHFLVSTSSACMLVFFVICFAQVVLCLSDGMLHLVCNESGKEQRSVSEFLCSPCMTKEGVSSTLLFFEL